VTKLLLDYWTLCKNSSYASSGGGGGGGDDDAMTQDEMVSQGNCQVVKDFPPLSTRSSNVNSGNKCSKKTELQQQQVAYEVCWMKANRCIMQLLQKI
jgi:hypothetical protein